MNERLISMTPQEIKEEAIRKGKKLKMNPAEIKKVTMELLKQRAKIKRNIPVKKRPNIPRPISIDNKNKGDMTATTLRKRRGRR